ncbi:MAG: acyltransferase [Paludisphaera borealis]|uniref:acyltransferase family protein n=1 Tax=Paludisphaera borealis TaxID=1387353 RepID=UPI0028469AEB|nr:acyltransferase [Paludisphaera borealis]MDR3618388.1 acyltransferase [Paludisphaera borealis]
MEPPDDAVDDYKDADGVADRHDAYLARTYIPALDGLRALSVLIVISVHMKDKVWDWLGGAQGVTVFFVLSGYLITRLALIEERKRGSLNKTAFFLRRTMRLFPLYFFVLGVYCVLIFGLGISPDKRAPLASALPYFSTYMQDVYFFLVDSPSWTAPFYQTWTLGVEEKFYLLWPFVGFTLWSRSRGRRMFGTVLLFAAAALAPLWAVGGFIKLIYPHSQILLGCLVAFLLDDRKWFARTEWLGRASVGWMIVALFLAIHFAAPVQTFWPNRLHDTCYAITTALLLTAILLGDGPIHHFLSRPLLVLLGRLSYGIYLIHLLILNFAEKIARPGTNNPMVSAAALVLAWAISAIVAWCLYKTIELPGIRIGRRLSANVLAADRARQQVDASLDAALDAA